MNESNNTSELEASTNPAIDYSTCYLLFLRAMAKNICTLFGTFNYF